MNCKFLLFCVLIYGLVCKGESVVAIYSLHDEFGCPVTNATITTITPAHAGTFSWIGPIKYSKHKVEGGNDGFAICSFDCPQGYFWAQISAEGYYSESTKEYSIYSLDGKTMRTKISDSIKVDVLMRQQVNPRKMEETKSIRIQMKKEEGIVFFDISEGDFVVPDGTGKIPDLKISYKRFEDRDTSVCTGVVSFVNGGAYCLPLMESSNFRVIRNAEVAGKYEKDYPFYVVRCPGDKSKRRSSPPLNRGDYWVIRIREKRNEAGELISARYGVMFGCVFAFDYFGYPRCYLNPSENDTNLEDDRAYEIQKRDACRKN